MKTSSLQHIKRETGIYALLKNGIVVYVGHSRNVYTRILEHLVDNEKDFDDIKCIYNQDLLNVQVTEVVIIELLNPKYNVLRIDLDLYYKILPKKIKEDLSILDKATFIDGAKNLINKLVGVENA